MISKLTIASTWDGQPLPTGLHAVLRLIAAGPDLRIDVDAPFNGDPPPSAPPGPVAGLWDYEVVELFLAGPGAAYTEIELGPHGHHLVLLLDGVRNIVRSGLPIRFSAEIRGNRWHGTALVPLALLPAGPHRANAYAIAGTGADRRYHASTPVPGPKPEFHQPDRFAPLVLPR